MKNEPSILRQVPRRILIAILIGAGMVAVLPSIGRPGRGRQRAVRTLDDLNALSLAFEAFESEYEKPPNTPSLDFETEGPDTVKLITVLLGKEDSASNMQNPRQILFLTIRLSNNKRRGGLVLSPDDKPEGIYDAWGHPLRVILRAPGQATLTIPHAGKKVTTSTPAVVLSRGPDGKWGTKDDLVSEIEKK